MPQYIVEMKNISKRFPGILANDNISMGIKKGEIFAILGENGAGKSTLMSMLFGMYEPDEGSIYIRGEKTKISSPNMASKLDIGMVHQHFKLVPNYTIAENIVLGLEPEKKWLGFLPYVDLNGACEKIRRLSVQYGLEVEPADIIENVNVSTRQRVEILKMLYRKAEILIFDEPTAMLTPQEIDFFLKIVENLRSNGKTIILITHKLEEIKKVADRCAILCAGRLTGILDVAATSTKEMANLMVGREISLNIVKSKLRFGKEILRVEHLTVLNSHGFKAVDDVSLSIRSGEILAIAGVSGNGQIELADAIAGLMKPVSGRITLNGTDVTDWSIRKRTMEGISYLPEDRQHTGLVLDFTMSDNLALKSYFKRPFSNGGLLDKRAFEDNSREQIGRFDIRSSQGGETAVRSMSGGNQQKIIVAREIGLASPLMIFVQPTRGLDIGAISAIHKRIIGERDKGKAILLISLELDEIMACADTIAVIFNGGIREISPAGELSKSRVGEFMMGVTQSQKEGRAAD